ncbi:carboxylesterase family protein [Diplodia corticola]|uniref:Carboxylesterase family protein n=1 Tax=Diplodia corticola TaxID=236234 RepID=A0A1J9S1A5_9PEZI|nr:carboxylesterase family protein [Diplodia corticola]OJD34367.1 carboxylesterase family protein [Diplodia corticola]
MRLFKTAAQLAGAASALASNSSSTPTAKTINGTYAGRHLAGWDQDVFLGIPFAQPPVGRLRFRWPQSLNTSFSEVRDANEYGHTCIQQKSTLGITDNNDEDCLNLNIVRPSGYTNTSSPLPVLVWIYGGGLSAGSGADPQYNLSGIVKTAADAGQPMIGVSINYRLSIWGFLQSAQLLAEGSANAGLLDQRLALRWVQENIGAFGGDPSRVTAWGESAGAQSIALQMHAYGGRDDGLFSRAILESGGPTGASLNTLPHYNAAMENLTRTVGCWGASDPLSCLRDLPAATLHAARPSQVWNPLVDGDFLTAYPSDLRAEGSFVKVALLTGANTDEGTSFSLKYNLDNDTALANSLLSWRNYALSPPTVRRLLALYPDDATTPKPPFHVAPSEPFAQYGTQWRRSGAIGGDLVMVAQRRGMAEAYAAAEQDVWSYRFDTPLWNAPAATGANHFCNVVFSFQNISGALGPYPSYKELSLGIGRAYANFVATGDPNGRTNGTGEAVAALPHWPKYELAAPVNMVLIANGSFVEDDTWRKEGIAYINTHGVLRELLS